MIDREILEKCLHAMDVRKPYFPSDSTMQHDMYVCGRSKVYGSQTITLHVHVKYKDCLLQHVCIPSSCTYVQYAHICTPNSDVIHSCTLNKSHLYSVWGVLGLWTMTTMKTCWNCDLITLAENGSAPGSWKMMVTISFPIWRFLWSWKYINTYVQCVKLHHTIDLDD